MVRAREFDITGITIFTMLICKERKLFKVPFHHIKENQLVMINSNIYRIGETIFRFDDIGRPTPFVTIVEDITFSLDEVSTINEACKELKLKQIEIPF